MTEYRDDQMTGWFPPHPKPVHKGVYDTNLGYAYWNGWQWGCAWKEPLTALLYPDYYSAVQDKRWRGLNFNPAPEGRA